MIMSPIRILATGLTVQLLVMAGLFMVTVRDWTPPVAKHELTSGVSDVQAPVLQGMSSGYVEQVERPLFVETRRPISVNQDEGAQREALPENAELIGVYGGGADHGGVILRVSGKVKRLPVGARIEGAVLMRIEGHDAYFFANGQETRLSIKPLPREVRARSAESSVNTGGH